MQDSKMVAQGGTVPKGAQDSKMVAQGGTVANEPPLMPGHVGENL